nr:hypothetical protein CFP56_37923 [Quercus suber]
MPFLLNDDGEGGFEKEIVADCNSAGPIDEDREVAAAAVALVNPSNSSSSKQPRRRALNMDQLFDMCIHRGGVFITHSDTHVEYVRGTESGVSDVDIDTLAVFDMPKYAKNLDGDVRALRDWLEFVPEKLIHIYVKHVEQAFEEQVDEDQDNEGDDEHGCYKEVDEGVGVDDNFFDEDYADLVGDSEFDRYEKPSSPNDLSSHIIPSISHDQANLNPYEKKNIKLGTHLL